MAIALVVSVSAASTNGNAVTTSAIDTTGANLLVLLLGEYASGTTPSDSKSNNWTALNTYTGGVTLSRLWYVKNPTVGSGHTFTGGKSTNYPAIAVLAFSGADTSAPFDVQNGISQGSNVTSQATGSITPGSDGEVVVAGGSWQADTSAASVDSGMTLQEIKYHTSNSEAAFIAYKVQGTAAAINPTFSWTTSVPVALSIASFKAGAGGGTTVSLTGTALNFSQGTLTPSDTVSLTGFAPTFAQGSVTPSDAVSLTGYAPTFAQGSVTPSDTVSLTGFTPTFSQGSLTSSSTVTLTGASLTFTQGTVTAVIGGNVTVTLSGTALTFTQGSPLAATTASLTGQAMTLTPGTVVAQPIVTLTGSPLTFSQGTFTVSNAVTLQGILAQFKQGTLYVAGGAPPYISLPVTVVGGVIYYNGSPYTGTVVGGTLNMMGGED
jgi:hypothetical protein